MMRVIREVCLGIVCLNLWGCANTQPTHFYLLRAMDVSSSSTSQETKLSGIALGVGPITIPKYLDRPQIVTRVSAHEIDLAEFHKWAAPLKENISLVLEENLSALLSTQGIVSYPWNRSQVPDYQLSVDIMQLDATKNQNAMFKVRWTLAREDGRKVLHNKMSQFSEVLRGSGYEGLVAAMSRMLTTFSQEIADAISAIPPSSATVSSSSE